MENKGRNVNRKTIFLILIVLALVIVALVIGIVVANNTLNKENKEAYEKYVEKVEMNNLGIADCEEIQNAYDSGMINVNGANGLYEDYYTSSENDDYKIYLTICYANYIFDKDSNLDRAVGLVEGIESLIKENEDKNSYYNALIYYYGAVGDNEKVDYYQQLQDELNSVMYDKEGSAEDNVGEDE